MRALFALLVAVAAVLAATLPATADNRPETIALPVGWQPEGIAAGKQATLFIGSIGQGAVYAADAKSGEGDVLVPPHEGRNHIGLKFDQQGDRVFVAGGLSGGLFVYDASTGADVAAFDVDGGFVNDVALTGDTAYFTDSQKPVVYALPYTRDGVGEPQIIPVDIPYTTGNNANGIAATPDGRSLIIGQGNVGKLWLVDAATGAAEEIDLGGATLPNADGILLRGRTLFVVQNRLNQIAVVQLAGDLRSGTVREELTDPDFAVPTTVTRTLGDLYAVNAKFGTAPAGTPYEIVKVDR